MSLGAFGLRVLSCFALAFCKGYMRLNDPKPHTPKPNELNTITSQKEHSMDYSGSLAESGKEHSG